MDSLAEGAERSRKLIGLGLALVLGLILFEARTGYFAHHQLQTRVENAVKLVEAAGNAREIAPESANAMLEQARTAFDSVASSVAKAEGDLQGSAPGRLWRLGKPIVAGLTFWLLSGCLLIGIGKSPQDRAKSKNVPSSGNSDGVDAQREPRTEQDVEVLHLFAWLGLLAGLLGMVFDAERWWAVWLGLPFTLGLAAMVLLVLVGMLLGPKREGN